jgi:hypothetical protein
MLRHLKYTKAVRQLAGMARQKAMDRDALYHGTRFAELILKTGVLFYSDPGDPKVSFTRSPEVAAYWALLERDYDEGRGSVFIFDRQSLERRHKVEANPEVYWHTNTLFHDEAEEEVWANVIDIGNHVIGLVGRNVGVRISSRARTWPGARGACLALMLRLRCDNGARTGTISPSPLNARPKCVPAPGMY